MSTWPRDAFREAINSSSCGLKPLVRLVALAYADHARDQDHAFVTTTRLVEVTGSSRRSVIRYRQALVDAGWLAEKEAARQHDATRYWLRIPTQGCQPDTSGSSQGCQPDTSDESRGAQLAPLIDPGVPTGHSGVPDTTSRGARLAPNHHQDHRDDSPDDRSAREAGAIAALMIQHPGELDQAEAAAAVAGMLRWEATGPEKAIANLVRFAETRNLTEVRSFARRGATSASGDVHKTDNSSPCDDGCVDGWVGEDNHGRPIPCSTCHPKLGKRRGRAA